MANYSLQERTPLIGRERGGPDEANYGNLRVGAITAYKSYAPNRDYKMYGIRVEFTDFHKGRKTKEFGTQIDDHKIMNQVTFDYDEVIEEIEIRTLDEKDYMGIVSYIGFNTSKEKKFIGRKDNYKEQRILKVGGLLKGVSLRHGNAIDQIGFYYLTNPKELKTPYVIKNIQGDFLTCPLCQNIARNAVQTTCCVQVLCEVCAQPYVDAKVCPKCQKDMFSVKICTLARKVIGDLSGTFEPIMVKKNFYERVSRIGKTGKYYCGKKMAKCDCCNGVCGPTNGCNCVGCMSLDIESRKLPKWHFVNQEGATCKLTEGVVYCGRWLEEMKAYCAPEGGPNCIACRNLENKLKTQPDGYKIIWQ